MAGTDGRARGGTSRGPSRRVFAGLPQLARARAGLPHLHASVAAEVLALSDPGVLPVLRRHPLGPMLGLYNMTDNWRPWPGARLAELRSGRWAWTASPGTASFAGADGNLWLPPYAALWITAG